jgi:hypothetical protein
MTFKAEPLECKHTTCLESEVHFFAVCGEGVVGGILGCTRHSHSPEFLGQGETLNEYPY